MQVSSERIVVINCIIASQMSGEIAVALVGALTDHLLSSVEMWYFCDRANPCTFDPVSQTCSNVDLRHFQNWSE